MITFRISRKYVFRILFEFRMRQIRDTLFSYRMSVYFFPGMCVCVVNVCVLHGFCVRIQRKVGDENLSQHSVPLKQRDMACCRFPLLVQFMHAEKS